MHAFPRLLILLFALESLLFIPLFAMLFTSEVNWSLFDFGLMAFLLSLLAIGIESVNRFLKSKLQKWLALAALLFFFLLVWAELAVGLFGTPLAGN